MAVMSADGLFHALKSSPSKFTSVADELSLSSLGVEV
jgi:hypothetical protein